MEFFGGSMFLILILCVCGIGVVGVGILMLVVGIYNRLQQLNILTQEAWSGIDVQLKKRFDLIPNLVETVKAYAKQEEKIFTEVAKLRSGMMAAETPQELGKLEGELRGTLKTLFAVAENYPELKSDQNFLQLQSALQEIETEIESARRYYNGVVRDLNTQLIVFPNNFIAGFFPNLKARQFFEVTEPSERENVKVDFSSSDEAK
jgi:LemA protein